MSNICFAFLTFEKKFYVASAHECAQGTWVFLLAWKIFSQTKFFPHGLQGLQIRLPTGSAWSSLWLWEPEIFELVPAPSWKGAVKLRDIWTKRASWRLSLSYCPDLWIYAVSKCTPPRNNCNPLDMPKNRKKRWVSKQAQLGLLMLSSIPRPVGHLEGRMVGNSGRKLLGHLVKFHSRMGVDVVVVIKIVSHEGQGHN